MADFPILSVLLLLPIIGVLIILTIKNGAENAKRNIRQVALLTTLATFVLSIIMWSNFDNAQPGFQFSEYYPWISAVHRPTPR